MSDRALAFLSISLGVVGIGIQILFPTVQWVGWLFLAVGGLGLVYSFFHDRASRELTTRRERKSVKSSKIRPVQPETFNGSDNDVAKIWLVPEDGGHRWNLAFRNKSGTIATNISARLTDLLWFSPQTGNFVQTEEFHPTFPAFTLLQLAPPPQLFAGESTRFRLITAFGRRVTIHSTDTKHQIANRHLGTWKATLWVEWRLGANLEHQFVVLHFHIDDGAEVTVPPTRPTD